MERIATAQDRNSLAGACECGYELSGSMKVEGLLPIENRLASQEGLCSMDSVTYINPWHIITLITSRH